MTEQPTRRIRINRSRSTKGVITFGATIEISTPDVIIDDVLAEIDELNARLRAREKAENPDNPDMV